MTGRRPASSIALMVAAALCAFGSLLFCREGLAKTPRGDARADATALYNEGTSALAKGDIGPAVLLLTAAARLEPRAADIRANLENALRLSAQARGEDGAEETAPRWPLAADEAWWVAAILLAAAVLLTFAGRRFRLASLALLVVGIALSAAVHVLEWREAHRPEAVVVTPTLSVEHGPEEAVRPTIVLGAGERVHLGRSTGTRVEVWIGGASIGWAARDGLWRVADAARYTSRLE